MAYFGMLPMSHYTKGSKLHIHNTNTKYMNRIMNYTVKPQVKNILRFIVTNPMMIMRSAVRIKIFLC